MADAVVTTRGGPTRIQGPFTVVDGTLSIAPEESDATNFLVLDRSQIQPLYVDHKYKIRPTWSGGCDGLTIDSFGGDSDNTNDIMYFECGGKIGLSTKDPLERLDVGAGAIALKEITDPDPDTDCVKIYAKEVGGITELFCRNSAGTITPLTST